jgi:hypothetical protein
LDTYEHIEAETFYAVFEQASANANETKDGQQPEEKKLQILVHLVTDINHFLYYQNCVFR